MAITFPASPSDGDVFTNTTTGVKYIYNATDGVWKTHVWPTNTNYLQLSGGTLTGDLSLGTNDLTVQDITTTGAVSVGTGLTVGNGLTVSDGNIVMANGHGIDFSATADSSASMGNELFDDYEEGSWTPAFSSGGWTGFATIYAAKYTKTGRTVHVQMFGNTLQGTGNTGSVIIEGLPFSAPANTYAVGSTDFAQVVPTSPYCRKEGNNDRVGFYYTSGSTSSDRVPVKGNQIGSGYMIFSITYTV